MLECGYFSLSYTSLAASFLDGVAFREVCLRFGFPLLIPTKAQQEQPKEKSLRCARMHM